MDFFTGGWNGEAELGQHIMSTYDGINGPEDYRIRFRNTREYLGLTELEISTLIYNSQITVFFDNGLPPTVFGRDDATGPHFAVLYQEGVDVMGHVQLLNLAPEVRGSFMICLLSWM